MQHKCLTKLLGYDYDIVFKDGHENRVVDALSRQEVVGETSLTAITVVQTDWLTALQQAWQNDATLKDIIADLTLDPTSHEGYVWSHGVLTNKEKLAVGSDKELRDLILKEIHSSAEGGHSGMERTYKRGKWPFY